MSYNLTSKIMSSIATTKMSSRGQVVIPEKIRERLKLKPGTEFVIIAKGDVVLFKKVSPPSWEQFDALIREARRLSNGRSRAHDKDESRARYERVRFGCFLLGSSESGAQSLA